MRQRQEEVLITRHGKPAAVVVGFRDEDDWFDYKMEHDERFLRRIAKSQGGNPARGDLLLWTSCPIEHLSLPPMNLKDYGLGLSDPQAMCQKLMDSRAINPWPIW